MFYRLAWVICRIILFLMRRWEIYGQENVPANGGLVVASNHVSYWDPVAVGCALNRKIYFMAKAELFSVPVFGRVISGVGAFPVYRGGADPKAIKKALKLLQQGQAIGIFPEGTRSRTDKLLEPHVGAAMLAVRGKVPVLPVGLIGTKGVFGKVKVNIGKPMVLSLSNQRKNLRECYKALSVDIMKEISQLMEMR